MRAARYGFILAVMAWVGGVRGQQVLFENPAVRADGSQLIVLPLDERIGDLAEFRGDTPTLAGISGELPPVFPNILSVDLGFQYLQPHFNHRAVALTIPAGVAGSFPVLADANNLSNDFGFVPKFGAAYEFSNLGFGLRASGQLLSLSGELHQTSVSAAGTADLTAKANVNIGTITFLEAAKTITADNCECLIDTCFEDCQFVFTIGGRYAHVDQTFTATLTGVADAQVNVTATQDFDGFGPTASLGSLCPLGGNFFWYNFSRGSFLVGNNDRTSASSVAVADSPDSGGIKLTENRTTIVPVGEFDFGFAYLMPLETRRAAAVPPTLVWFKIGAVLEVWGDLSLLSITDGPQQFSDGGLFLYGFNILFGFQH